jgi:5-methylcytosine-specific restriction endonuclease McrA
MKKNGKTFICKNCGKEYYVPKYRFNTTVACSDECNRKARIKIIIQEKGDKISHLYQEGNSIRDVAFLCDTNSRTVVKVLNMTATPIRTISQSLEGKPKMVRGTSVRETHRTVLARGCCEKCGSKDKLEIHHIDGRGSNYPYKLRNENIENLMLICHGCHLLEENVRRQK